MVYTSYFSKVKELIERGYTPISIAKKTPEGIECIHNTFLTPDWGLITLAKKGEYDKYTLEYVKRFKDVDMELFRMYFLKFEKPVLLCYEKPGDFCHRHLVARWLTLNGIECEEVSF
jgi:hypothetical protein